MEDCGSGRGSWEVRVTCFGCLVVLFFWVCSSGLDSAERSCMVLSVFSDVVLLCVCFWLFASLAELGFRCFGALWGLFGASWGPLGAAFGPLGGLLGASWGPLGASWEALGAS